MFFSMLLCVCTDGAAAPAAAAVTSGDAMEPEADAAASAAQDAEGDVGADDAAL